MMTVMSMVLSDLKNMKTDKILKMSLIHDWAESKIGDFMPNEITHEKKTELEEYAMIEILEVLPVKLKEDYYSLWDEYKENSSIEARFVHELDKLEMVIQAKLYQKNGIDKEKIRPFIESASNDIKTDNMKKILKKFIEETQ